MIKIAFRNVIRSKWRTFLLIFGITITIALETGIVVTVDTMHEDFLFDNRKQSFTDITVNPKRWMNKTELNDLMTTLKTLDDVKKASEVYYLFSSDLLQNETGDFIDILVYGINFKTHPDAQALNLTEGFRIVSGPTILVSQLLMKNVGLSLGDKLKLEEKSEIGFRGADLVVGGVFSVPPFFGNRENPFLIIIDIDTILTRFYENYLMNVLKSKIDITINNIVDIKNIVDNIKDLIGPDFNVYAEKDISELQVLGINAYSVAMNIVILASLLVEFLFTTNMLTIVIRERQKEYGILRSTGISSKQLLLIIFYEVIIYSLIGSLLGILVGIGFSNFLVALLDQFYTSISFQTLFIRPPSLFIIIISGVLIILLAGIYPTYMALKVNVIQNIHSRMRTEKKTHVLKHWKYLVLIGFILAVSGYLLSFFVGPGQFLQFSVFSGQFLVIILIFLGTLVFEAGLVVFLPKIGYRVLFIFNGVPRLLSMRNISREFHRSLFTIMTTTVALTFIIFVGIVSTAIIASVPQYYEDQWGVIDLVIETPDNNPLPISFTENLTSNELIKQSAFIQESRTEINSINAYVYGIDPSQYIPFSEIVLDSFQGIPEYTYLSHNASSQIFGLISDNLFNSLNVSLGENISVKYSINQAQNVTLGAVIRGNAFLGDGRYLYINSDHFQLLFNSSLARLFVCNVFDSTKIQEARTNITLSYPDLNEVISIDYYRNIITKSLNFQANLFQVLFLESFILSFFAQFVTILISTLELEREMGIMRSMGLSKIGVFNIFLAESTVLCLSGLVFGLLDGIFGAILLIWYISYSIPIKLIFPIEKIVIWLIVSLLVTIASTTIPGLRSSQKEVIATISARPMRSIRDRIAVKAPISFNTENILVPSYITIFIKILVICYYLFILILIYMILDGVFFGNGL